MIVNFNDFIDTLKETSKDPSNGEYMTELSNSVINFDLFQSVYYEYYKQKVTCSIDALIRIKDTWFFIEFKNGKIDSKQKRNISEKVGHSVFSFIDNIGENTKYCQDNVNFILVYNEKVNKAKNNKLKKNEYQLSDKREMLKSKFPGIKRYIPLFQMGRYKNVYFKNVYTYSIAEFENFVLQNFPKSNKFDN